MAQTDVAGSHGFGKFSIDAAGTWTYTMNSAHDEFVGGTDYTDSITVATADGTSQVITVTMHGTNDAAVITGSSTAALTETNAAQCTGGTLMPPTWTARRLRGADRRGRQPRLRQVLDRCGRHLDLHDEQRPRRVRGRHDYTDSITVATADGTSQVITVTMHGTNDDITPPTVTITF